MIRIISVLAMVWCVSLPATHAADDVARKQLEEKIKALWTKHSSMKATINGEAEVAGERRMREGQYELKLDGSKALIRIDDEQYQLNESGHAIGILRSLYISDGEFVHSFIFTEKEARKWPDQGCADPRRKLECSEKYGDLVVKLGQTVDGEKVDIVEVVKKGEEANRPVIIRMYFREDGMMIREERLDPSGRVLQNLTMRDIKFDINPPPEHFVFELPEGVVMNEMEPMKGE